MSIDPVGGNYSAFDSQAFNSAPMDKQTFGAAVVAKTLDYLNGQSSSGSDLAPVDKQTFGAAVVSKTLDYLNAGHANDNGMAQSYDFQKSVLGGHADAIGALANIKV